MPLNAIRVLIGLAAGALFGAGLALSGMTDRHIVLAFLDIAGAWNPSLALVMIGALTVSVPAFFVILKLKKPLCDARFFMPVNQFVDRKLMLGAVLFGVGWGLYGLCPGPAVASLIYGNVETLVFFVAMLAGLVFPKLWEK